MEELWFSALSNRNQARILSVRSDMLLAMSQLKQMGKTMERAIREGGTPQVVEDTDGLRYVVLQISILPTPDSGFRASIDEFIPIYGEGDTPEEALIAFQEILKSAIQHR